MAEFSQFNLYAMAGNMKLEVELDEIDKKVQQIRTIHEYSELKDYLQNEYGPFEGIKWVDGKGDKQVYMKITDECVEFCAVKNGKTYFGRGLKLISKTES